MLSKKENAVMLVFVKLCGWAGKMYVYPGRPKIVKLCKRWFSVPMSQRTLSRVISSLGEGGYIGRQVRKSRSREGQVRSHTSLTFLKWRSLNLLSGLGALSGLARKLTERTKVAPNISPDRRSSGPCGQLASLVSQAVSEGAATPILNSS